MKQLLIITHNTVAKSAGGGVELYQEYLRDMPGFKVSYLFPMKKNGIPKWVFQGPDKKYYHFDLNADIPSISYSDEEREVLLGKIIKRWKIDIIHFQHLLWLPLSLPLIARKYGIPSVYTLHDHHLICSRFNLIGMDGEFCNTYNQPINQCDFCLKTSAGFPFGTQAKRRAFIQKVLHSVDAIISSTPYLMNGILKIYPETDPLKFHVIEMISPKRTQPKRSPRKGTELRVAVPGNFTTIKGAIHLLRLFEGLSHNNQFSFTVMGRIQEKKIQALSASKKFPNVQFLYGYSPDETPHILAEHDISLHLTICPESYMITLSEVWNAGVVPIVSNLGAPAERVRDGENGYVVQPKELGKIYRLMDYLANNPKKLEVMSQRCSKIVLSYPNEHIEKVKKLYKKFLE